MNIRKYEVFLKVVEMGSLTRAAEALGYTQSGISHIVNALEDELGFTLIRRSRAGVTLTDNGERVLPALRNILSGAEQLNQIVSAIQGLSSGKVRVGAFTSVAVNWLPGMLKEFERAYPRIEFQLFSGDYADIDRWLSDGSVDIAFVADKPTARCELIPLKEDRLLAILPKEHKCARLNRFPVTQVRSEPFISLLADSDQDMRRALDLAGIRPNIKYATKDDYAIIAMVENGLGISIMPELLLNGRTGNLRAMELEPCAKRMIELAVPETVAQSPAAKKFTEHIIQWVKNHYLA